MTSLISIVVNGQRLDVSGEDSIDFRLNRFVQDIQNFQVKGGEYSTTLTLPKTKNNCQILGVTYASAAINKFNRELEYNFSFELNGVSLLNGTFLITKISSVFIEIELYGESIDWIQRLDEKNLNRLGYVNDQPTWFGGDRSGLVYEGGSTINIINEYADIYGYGNANRYTDYICPTIARFNTPQTDYLAFQEADIFGLYDSSGTQVLAPKDFPDSFKCQRAFYGSRPGLTFEDFPPAVYYRNILEKCFEEIGYNITASIFNEDWFNSLYVPYKGDAYLWNWNTLAELQVTFAVGRNINLTDPSIVSNEEVFVGNNTNTKWYSKFKIGNSDDLPNRVDRISNFNKFLVSDETNGYVVPAKGKYKIRLVSLLDSQLNGNPSDISLLDTIYGFKSLSGEKGYGETVFVILRKSPTGETLLREDPILDVAKWMQGDYDEFTSTPSDIIAYFSAFQANYLGTVNDTRVKGSPLTNFETEVNSYTWSYSQSFGTNYRSSFSSCNFDIEVDLLENERVEFYAISLVAYENATVTVVTNIDCTVNNNASLITIDYLCGNEDIDLAANLPEISCKDFVRSFINTFNQRWIVDDKNKTVRFFSEQEFFNTDLPYDITARVDYDTVSYSPTGVPKNLTIGYDNDADDAELNELFSECVEDVYKATSYANKRFLDNKNIYSQDTLNLTNLFSATRFVEAYTFSCTDFNTLTKSLIFTTHPVTGNPFTKGVVFGTKKNYGVFTLPVPSLQSLQSINELTVGDLTYTFNQDLRLLSYLGTAGSVYNTIDTVDEDYRFFINAPEFDRMLESDFWIRPTISSFDLENVAYNADYTPYNANIPTQSLRYDVTGGLYDKFFNNIVELQNKSYVLTCQAYLRGIDWNSLQANRVIMFNEVLYRLLEIQDYDVTSNAPCTLKMLKL